MQGKRIDRLTSLLKEEISLIIQRELKDPRIHGIIGINHLKLAKDHKTALVFISIMEGTKDEKEAIMEGLISSAHYIRKRLGKILTLKYIPHIKFKLDDSIEKGMEFYYKIKQMEDKERELGWHDNNEE